MAEIKRGRSESDWKEQSRGKEKKEKQERARENRKTEREREHKLCHHVSLCKSSNVCLMHSLSPAHLLTYILPALAVSTHCLFMSHQHTHTQTLNLAALLLP